MASQEHSTLSILVVEDNPGVADLLRELLNDVEGWGATVAPDASAAIATFQQVQIDVLVLDIDLPGISGLELLELLHQEPGWHDQPVILVSAKVGQPVVQDAIRKAQVTEVVQKPFDVDQLVRIIQEAASK
jgi:two-component system, sensor histidine kinase